jgi:hypothetical protein
MPEVSFFLGLAIGVALMGFVTIGSFDRGADSARLHPWKLELAARRHALMTARLRQPVIDAFVPDVVRVPLPGPVVASERTRPVPTVERRTPIRRDDVVLAHMSP